MTVTQSILKLTLFLSKAYASKVSGKNSLCVKSTTTNFATLWRSAFGSSICCMALLLVASCASLSHQACLSGQWQDIGYSDGSAGKFAKDSLASHGKACAKHGVSLNADDYRSGHARGLALFCKPETAYTLANSEQIYNHVCPAEYEREFLVAYTEALSEKLDYLQGEDLYLQNELLKARTQHRFFDPVEGATNESGVAINSFVSRANPVAYLFENQVNYQQDRRIRLRNAFNRARLRLRTIAPELFE